VSLLDKTEGGLTWEGGETIQTGRIEEVDWTSYENEEIPAWVMDLNEFTPCVVTGMCLYTASCPRVENASMWAGDRWIWVLETMDLFVSNYTIEIVQFVYPIMHFYSGSNDQAGYLRVCDVGAGVIVSADLWQTVMADWRWTGEWQTVASTSMIGGRLYTSGEGVGSGKSLDGYYTAGPPWTIYQALDWAHQAVTSRWWEPSIFVEEGPPSWTMYTFEETQTPMQGRLYHTGRFPVHWRFTRCRKPE